MRSFPLRSASGLVVTALGLVGTDARAELVVPLASRLGPPVAAPAHRGACGKFTDFGTMPFNPHTPTTITEYLPLVTGCTVGGPTEALRSVVSLVPAFDFAKPSATCSAPGDFSGGGAWPTQGGLMSAARIQGFLNVPGPEGAPVKWTFFVAGNDSIRVTIGDAATPALAVNWYSKSWKAAEYVTFPAPGVYAIDVTWATNHVCVFDSLELSIARSQVAGFDGATCLSPPGGGEPRPESQCRDAFVPTAAFEIVGEQLLMPAFDGGGSCLGCCADADCAGETPACLPSKICGCQVDADCKAAPGAPFCDVAAGRCRGCDSDGQCTADGAKAWCANAPGGICVPLALNGETLPVLATCTPEHGQVACLSGVCSAADQACGALVNEACATNDQCRAGRCAADGRCGVLAGGACAEGKDCRGGLCADDVCVACTATNLLACTGTSPACDVVTGTCVPCAFSAAAAATSPLCPVPSEDPSPGSNLPKPPRHAPRLPPHDEPAAGRGGSAAGAPASDEPAPSSSASAAGAAGRSDVVPLPPWGGESGGAVPTAAADGLEGGSCQLAPAAGFDLTGGAGVWVSGLSIFALAFARRRSAGRRAGRSWHTVTQTSGDAGDAG